jgi:hypothetical protein
MAALRFCTQCGHELRPGARFCTNCGRVFNDPGQEVPTSAADYAAETGGAASEAPAESLPTLPPETWQARGSARPYDPSLAGQETRNWSPTPAYGAPSVQPAYSPAPSPGPVPPRRSRWPLLAAAIAVVVLGGGTAVALVVLPSHPKAANTADKTGTGVTAGHSSAATAPTTPATAASATASASATALPPRQQAAQALAALLVQSGADRSEVTGAVSAVENCSADLNQDETIFSAAASSRRALLSRLATLPGRPALPAAMLRDLTAAWTASGEADQDFVSWTQDEISGRCTTDDQSDANFQAATGPDDRATRYKKAFARQWASIATEYDLPVYQYNQI